MMGTLFKVIRSFVIFMLLLQSIYGATLVSTILNEDYSTSSLSLGKSIVGKADDISMISRNPAAVNSNLYMSGYYFQKFDFANNLMSYASYGFSFWKQNFAVSLALAYPVDVIEYNDFGTNIGKSSVFDVMGGLYWGNFIDVSENKFYGGRYEVGLGVKVFHSRIIEYNMTGLNTDLGFTYRRKITSIEFLPNQRRYNFSVGFSVLHLGPAVKFTDTKEQQPRMIQSGFEYWIWSIKNHEVSILSGLNLQKDSKAAAGFGLEYMAYSIVKVRLGYLFEDAYAGLTAGMGLQYSYHQIYDMQLNYSLGLRGELGNDHAFGLQFNYNKGILQKNVQRVAKESEDLNSKIDKELLEMISNCIHDYKQKNEKYPDNLNDTIPCIQEYGFGAIPQPIQGEIVYNPQTGEAKVVRNSGGAKEEDILYLTDGSMIKGTINKVEKDKIGIMNSVGKIEIPRELLKYAIVHGMAAGDVKLLNEVKDIIKQIKDESGDYPKDVTEVSDYFKIKTGLDMPKPSSGEYMYESGTGKINIVNNFRKGSDLYDNKDE